jgi:hypothetical protein
MRIFKGMPTNIVNLKKDFSKFHVDIDMLLFMQVHHFEERLIALYTKLFLTLIHLR